MPEFKLLFDQSIVAFIVAVFLTLFTVLWRDAETKKLRQDKILHRETHNLNLFKVLAEDNQKLQLSAAAVLVERLGRPAQTEEDHAERRSIIRALISVTKDLSGDGNAETGQTGGRASPELIKYVADSVLRALDVVGNRKTGKGDTSPMAAYDWQGASLDRGWLPYLNARRVDFWQASLSACGLKHSDFSYAVLKDADLRGSVLREAKLDHCDMRGADLRGTNLKGCSVENTNFEGAFFNGDTILPTPSFDSTAHGLIYCD